MWACKCEKLNLFWHQGRPNTQIRYSSNKSVLCPLLLAKNRVQNVQLAASHLQPTPININCVGNLMARQNKTFDFCLQADELEKG